MRRWRVGFFGKFGMHHFFVRIDKEWCATIFTKFGCKQFGELQNFADFALLENGFNLLAGRTLADLGAVVIFATKQWPNYTV